MPAKATVGKVLSADGTEIAFEKIGAGPPVILVGGALADRSFGPLAELASLLAADFTVYTYDRRGRGYSGDSETYSIAREVEDLAALVGEAGGWAHAYGLSSGAILVLEAAAARVPLTTLVLFEPPVPVEDGVSSDPEFEPRLAELISSGRRGDAVEYFLSGVGLPPEAIAATRQSPAWPGMEAMAHTLAYDSALSEDPTLVRERLPAVNAPTLVIASAGSGEGLGGSARAVVDALPKGLLRTMEGGHHDVPAADMAPVIRAFLTEG